MCIHRLFVSLREILLAETEDMANEEDMEELVGDDRKIKRQSLI